jgi:hypothetical protein
MGPSGIAEAPDGSRWRVRRRWLDRPLPNLRRRFRRDTAEEARDGLFRGFDVFDLASDVWWALAAAVVVFVFLLVLLPLLSLVLQIVAVLILLSSGLFGRLVLGRPWIVEAVPVDGDPELRAVFAVKGWRESGQAVAELRTAITAAGVPPDLVRGERLATRPGGGFARPS